MRPNGLVLASNRNIASAWKLGLEQFKRIDSSGQSRIEQLVSSHRQGKACKVVQEPYGAFNYCFIIRFVEDGEQWVLRFPIPGDTMNPSDKVQVEVATMRFIREKTTIPIPRVIAAGEFPELGPYILMEFVQGRRLDGIILEEDESLRRDVDEAKLRKIYQQLANVHLQLCSIPFDFDKIGSLSMTNSESGSQWIIGSAPLTHKSNEIERMGGVQSEAFLNGSYDSDLKYVEALLEQSLHHLRENTTAGDNEEEALDDSKTISDLKSSVASFYDAKERKEQKFLLFNDDLAFRNIIVDDDLTIRAIIDWEFCYAAPESFLKSPPSWLIGLEPFEWKENHLREYDERLQIYLDLLEREEEEAHCSNDLSTSMRSCRKNGTFWFNLAIRESFLLKRIMDCWKLDPVSNAHFPGGCDEMEAASRSP